MKIFITGGCGFVGVNLVHSLAQKQGYDFVIFDNLSIGKIENLPDWTDKIIVGDTLDKSQVLAAMKGCDAAVHLAAHTNVIDSVKNPESCVNQNVMGVLNVLEACRALNIRKFVLASSNAALGEQKPPLRENMIPAPVSAYGMSKLSGEALCSAYFHSYGIDAIALRFANVYGPYSTHKSSVVAKFMKRILKREPLIIYGDGRQTRDFVHVHDIVDAIILALNADAVGRVFQIGTGVETSIKDLFEHLGSIVNGYAAKIKYEEARPGEILKNYTDFSKANKFLGFSPRVQLTDGLTELWDWFRKTDN